MFVLSFSFRNSVLDLRSQFNITTSKKEKFFQLLSENGISQAVFLSTCNRTELIVIGDSEKALSLLCEYCKVDEGVAGNFVKIHEGNDAIKHLFYLACGLDSMVVGEDEILGQVKEAYIYSLENGHTKKELNTVFQSSIACGKKVKSETLISKSAVSIASLAATKVKNFRKNGTVLLIGASGDTGEKVLKNLESYGFEKIFCTVRKSEINLSGKAEVIDYHDRYSYISTADIVISATKSPHYTLSFERTKDSINSDKSRLFIDLSSPRDIETKVSELENITLISLDDFLEIAKENEKIKALEIEKAKEIAELSSENYIKKYID